MKKDRERKRKGKRRKERPVAQNNNKGVSGKMNATNQKHQAKRKDAVRKYITQHVPGTHLTFEQRQTLSADWNELIRAGRRITMRQFAAKHGLNFETWRREYHRRAEGAAVPDDRGQTATKVRRVRPLQGTVGREGSTPHDAEAQRQKEEKVGLTHSLRSGFLFLRHLSPPP